MDAGIMQEQGYNAVSCCDVGDDTIHGALFLNLLDSNANHTSTKARHQAQWTFECRRGLDKAVLYSVERSTSRVSMNVQRGGIPKMLPLKVPGSKLSLLSRE
jgi:hypothetical protein